MVIPLVKYGCESWTIKKAECEKNWCFRTVVLQKTLESPLYSKEIKPINPKGNHSWIFIRTTDAKAETPIIWPPDAKGRIIGKDLDAGKYWSQGEKEVKKRGHGWMASPTQSTWVWASSRRWWRTEKPGMLQFLGSQIQTWLSDWTNPKRVWKRFTNPDLQFWNKKKLCTT